MLAISALGEASSFSISALGEVAFPDLVRATDPLG